MASGVVARAVVALRADKLSTQGVAQRQQILLALYEELREPEHAQDPDAHKTQEALLIACESMQTNPKTLRAGHGDAGADSEVDVGAVAAAVTAQQSDGEATAAAAWDIVQSSNVRFDDVIGARAAVVAIQEALLFPRRYPTLYTRLCLEPWRTILLFGPPGTGKSMLAQAAASEIAATFFSVSCADVTSKWVGGSEKLLRTLFQDAAARAPAVVFFDEIDSIARTRQSDTNVADQRLTNQLLLELDKVQRGGSDIAVLAATNLPWDIDTAVLRRFSKRILVDLPDTADRVALLTRVFARYGIDFAVSELEQLAAGTPNFSGADLTQLVHNCAFTPLRELTGAQWWVAEDERVSVAAGADVPGAFADGFENIIASFGEDAVNLPVLGITDVLRAVGEARPALQERDIFRYRDYVRSTVRGS
tara:strand:+ start:3802 stop:5064 length:1263 start_codon:yes stop_codon:yes gene_type:complete